MKRTSTLMNSARTQVSTQAKRAYSSEMANALVQVSQNIGMGSAAIGLGGAGIGKEKQTHTHTTEVYNCSHIPSGIGLVFAALLQAVARNPSLRGQLFSYAILGFAFVEAIGVRIMTSHPFWNSDTDMAMTAVRPHGCHDVQVRLNHWFMFGQSGWSFVSVSKCAEEHRGIEAPPGKSHARRPLGSAARAVTVVHTRNSKPGPGLGVMIEAENFHLSLMMSILRFPV